MKSSFSWTHNYYITSHLKDYTLAGVSNVQDASDSEAPKLPRCNQIFQLHYNSVEMGSVICHHIVICHQICNQGYCNTMLLLKQYTVVQSVGKTVQDKY